MQVTSTTSPVTRSFSITVWARRFQGWNSDEKLRRMKVSAAAVTAENTAVLSSAGTVRANGTTPTRMISPPAIASRDGRRENSTQPITIAKGMAMRTSRLPVVGVMWVSVR